MAEEVGIGTVRIVADGTGLDKDIERELKKTEPAFKKGGKDGAESFNEGFLDEFKHGLEDVNKEIKKSPAQKGWDTRRFRQQLQAITDDVIDFKGAWNAANKDLDNARRLVARLGAQEKRLEGDFKWADRLLKQSSFEEFFKRSLVRAELFWGSVQTKGSRAFQTLKNGFGDIRRAEQTFGRLGSAMDDFAERSGRISGKGSRNNLLNFFGGLVEKSIQLVGVLPKAAQGMAGLFGGGGGGAEGGGKLASLASAAASSLAGVAIAIVAITAIAAPAAAALSGIAAALIALTSVAVFAAAAVGGVALALGATFAASVGVAILALKNLDQETKDSFDGLKKRFNDLGDSAGQSIGPGLRRAAGILDKTFANPRIEKLIDGIAQALGRVAVEFAKVTEGAPFRKFVNSMTVFLPDAIGKLGQITANFGEAFMGILRALEPLTTRFLNWLLDASQRFSDWANSVGGQNTLQTFFEKAGDSAAALGGLIADAGKAIGELLSSGNETGNTLVQDLRDQLQRFIRFMQNPKNQKSIKEFFTNGLQVARQFGRALQAAGRLFDALDGPNSRRAFGFIMGALTRLFNFWAAGVRTWSRIGNSIINFWTRFKNAANTSINAVKGFFEGLVSDIKKIPGEIADTFKGLGGKILSAIGSIDLSGIIKWPGGKLGEWARKAAGATAAGGVFAGAQHRIIGEAGPEAVVPLNRPLSLVDPSVRALSAFAQGLPFPGNPVSTNSRTIDVGGITINTPTRDPRAVAAEVVNRLAAVGY